MNKLLIAMLMVVVLSGCAAQSKPKQAGEAHNDAWLTDFEKAKELSASTGNPILANFSGSDWCHWCIKLEEEVFSKEEFLEYAADDLVLFVADFPQRREQPEELKAQNSRLAAEYGIQGIPTVLLISADGKEIERTGYQPGGPEKYIDHIKTLLSEKS